MNARTQTLAGRGEPDYRALSRATLDVEGALCDLVDTIDNAEQHEAGNAVQRAAETVRAVRRLFDAKLAEREAIPRCPNAGERWEGHEDHHLATYFGPAMRAHRGDFEGAVARLAGDVGRTPVAVALRLSKLGILTS